MTPMLGLGRSLLRNGGFGGAPAVPWTPAAISTALWLDAADASTLTLNGSTVSQWRDKSGNARHASQGTVANQPTYTANGLNGKPVVTFNNVNNWMQSSGGSLGAVTIFNAIVVWQTNTNDSTYDYLYQVGNTNNALSLSVGGPSAGAFAGNYYHLDSASPPSAFDSGTTAVFNQPVITSHLINQSSPTNVLFVNGNSRTVNPWPKTLNTEGTYTLGTNDQLPTKVHPLNGYISEIVFITNSSLSTTDRQRLEGYLAWKWGLVANLPSGHPYKNSPPTV
jgi:hypothetical protein